MKRTPLFLLSIGLVVFFCSCEGTTTQDWKVKNLSSETIQVTPSFHVVDMQVPTTTILPGEVALIASSEEGRGARPDAETHIGNVERILITTATDTASRDGTNVADWTSSSDHKRRVPSHWAHEHVMTVTDADLE